MKKKDLLEQLSDFPDNAEILIWHDDMGLVKTKFVAKNIDEGEDYHGAAVIYLDFDEI